MHGVTDGPTIPRELEVVHGAGLTLAAFSSIDIDSLRDVFADPEVQRWNPAPDAGGDPVEWVTDWFNQRNDWTTGDHLSWAVRDSGDALVGSVSLHHLDLDQADAELDNPVSCRVAERCGFRHEGTLRSSHRYGDGVYHDEHLHGRLASDPVPG